MAIIGAGKLAFDVVFVGIVFLQIVCSSFSIALATISSSVVVVNHHKHRNAEDVIHHAPSSSANNDNDDNNDSNKYIYNHRRTINGADEVQTRAPPTVTDGVDDTRLDLGAPTDHRRLRPLNIAFGTRPHLNAASAANQITQTRTTLATNENTPKFYPEHIHFLSTELNYTDLQQLNKSYNHLDKFGYLTHVRQYLTNRRQLFRQSRRRRRESRSKRQTPSGDNHRQNNDHSIVDVFRWSLKFYQKFMGLSVTGALDTVTVEHMTRPRCGNRDLGMEAKHQHNMGVGRSRRYVLAGNRWRKDNRLLDYCISRYPLRALHSNQHRLVLLEVSRAFDTWAKHLPQLRVEHRNCVQQVNGPVVSKPRVNVRFEVGPHGDDDPFDGPGGVLAHAYYPLYGGDLHFDETERWTNSELGSNLFVVSLHEIGHVLGLDHSEVTSSIMAPVYPKYRADIALTDDDIVGLRAIYEQ